jgi:acyl-CoA thioester hydrolase
MERGRTELLRELGVDFSSYHEKDTVFSVIEANVKYKQPARYNDLLTVVTNIKEVSGASLIFETQVRRGETLLVYGEVKLACVKLSTGMPKRIPGEIVSALKS